MLYFVFILIGKHWDCRESDKIKKDPPDLNSDDDSLSHSYIYRVWAASKLFFHGKKMVREMFPKKMVLVGANSRR